MKKIIVRKKKWDKTEPIFFFLFFGEFIFELGKIKEIMSIKLKDTIYDLINNSDKLDGKDSSSFSLTTHTHSQYLTELPSHTHNYASTVKIGSTSYNSSNNVISLPAYPTLSSLGAANKEHSHSYLPLSGGDLTGTITTTGDIKFYGFGNGTYTLGTIFCRELGFTIESPIKTENVSGEKYPIYITWRGGYSVQGGIKLEGGSVGYLGGYTILHSGNYSSYTATKNHTHSYLPLSGGTVTKTSHGPTIIIKNTTSTTTASYIQCECNSGNAIMAALPNQGAFIGEQNTTSRIGVSWTGVPIYIQKDTGVDSTTIKHTLWHSGNDGSDSGLDSDLLDGKHASAFSLTTHTHSNYAPSSHTHNYAGSSSAGGPATSIVSRTIWGQSFNGTGNVSGNLNATGSRVSASFFDITTYGTGTLDIATIFSGSNGNTTYGLCLEAACNSSGTTRLPIFIGWRGGKRIMNIQDDHGVSIHHRANIGQNTNGTAIIDAFDGIARFGCDDYGNGRNDSVGDKKAYISIKGVTGNIGIGTLTANTKLQVAGTITCTACQGDGISNNLTFRHLDGQNCNGDYDLFLQYHNTSNKVYFCGHTYYIDGSYYNGTSAAANKLATPRTLWGQSFDGTGNISGRINTPQVNITNIGSGTYNIGQMTNDSNYGLYFESALSSDSASSTKLPIFFGFRGGKKSVIISEGNLDIYYNVGGYSGINFWKNDTHCFHLSNRSNQNKFSIYYYDGTYHERGWVTNDGLFNFTAIAIGGEQITFTT